MKSRGSQAGFTILEVVLAMFVLLIGMSAMLGLLTAGAALARNAELRSLSSFSIDALAADLEETLFPLVRTPDGREIAGPPQVIERRPVPGHPRLSYSAVARENPGHAQRSDGPPDGPRDVPLEYRVDLQVFWTNAGRENTRRFTTLLLREVPFGERMRARQFGAEARTGDAALDSKAPPALRSARDGTPKK
jgi:hypothetical protein